MIDTNTKDSNITPVAFFDFDGTLTTGDTLMPFLKFVVGAPRYYWYLILVSPILLAYILKLIPNDIAKQKVLKRYLSGYPLNELFEKGSKFSQEIIPNMLCNEGMEKLRWHQNQQHTCVLVSASFDIWLKPWADSNGFDDILTTQLETKGGIVTGNIAGNNCYGQEKVRRIESWLNQEDLLPNYTYAYGDTKGDLPMLSVVNHGCMLKRNIFIEVQGNE